MCVQSAVSQKAPSKFKAGAGAFTLERNGWASLATCKGKATTRDLNPSRNKMIDHHVVLAPSAASCFFDPKIDLRSVSKAKARRAVVDARSTTAAAPLDRKQTGAR